MNIDDYSKFLMRVGFQVKNIITNEIATNFSKEQQGNVFHNLTVNIIANIVADVSQNGKVEENMRQIIVGLEDWLQGKHTTRVTYNAGKDEIIKEGLH